MTYTVNPDNFIINNLVATASATGTVTLTWDTETNATYTVNTTSALDGTYTGQVSTLTTYEVIATGTTKVDACAYVSVDILDTPIVEYKADNKMFEITPVDNASLYDVVITLDGTTEVYNATTASTTINMSDIIKLNGVGEYKISVVAQGGTSVSGSASSTTFGAPADLETLYLSSATATETATITEQLEAPTFVSFIVSDDGSYTATFVAVDNADTYTATINGADTTETVVDNLVTVTGDITATDKYTITLTASNSENINYLASEEATSSEVAVYAVTLQAVDADATTTTVLSDATFTVNSVSKTNPVYLVNGSYVIVAELTGYEQVVTYIAISDDGVTAGSNMTYLDGTASISMSESVLSTSSISNFPSALAENSQQLLVR